ncbi:zinc finger protein CONSTANS-LIKE 14-like isoform X1 [Salvia hispanica]|uniref:zinc finger protein CONSTANS-LIKE 14-like isoform X1 n=1 Tax=Salvia hispanica TaxID=49212 RepID=UPI002008EFA2|nr:zinc finger protein CONSTANS-LIKE 14-like isoform X1 [Salvia hispanica]
MSGPYWGQFSLHHAPAAERVYPALLGGGDYYDSIGHSSSGSSSHVDSPKSNSTTYGAHSPTLINCQYLIDTNVEAYYNIESENSHDSSQEMQQCYKWSNSSFASEDSVFESMNRAIPYSPEEKKERIERYRSKRNLRNFNKKIKYECRKTLADSRPRVRGRFAKNDVIEKATQCPFQEEDEDDYQSWITILDALNKSDLGLISSF